MSGATKSAIFSKEIVDDFEVALAKLKLLEKQLARASSAPSAKGNTSDASELDARRSELKAIELKLDADRAKFEAQQLEWEETSRDLKIVKAKLDAERLELEEEKSQLIQARVQIKAVQSRLQDAISKFEYAQAQLEEAKTELEAAQRHLEAIATQTDLNNARLEAAKASLEASEMMFEAATKELKYAKSKFEEAKTQLEVATSSIVEGSGTLDSLLEEENNELRIRVCELEREISNMKSSDLKLKAKLKEFEAKSQRFETEILNLKRVNAENLTKLDQIKDDNISLQAEISNLVDNILHLDKENSGLRNAKDGLEEQLKESQGELKQLKKKRQDDFSTLLGVTLGNPVVFFDIELRGVAAGRIVMELYNDTSPRLVEVFLALCNREKRLPGTDRIVGYKGASFILANWYRLMGGNVRVENRAEFESIYGAISCSEISSGKRNGAGDL